MDSQSQQEAPPPSASPVDESVSKEATTAEAILFDFSAFPEDTLFHERRIPIPSPADADADTDTDLDVDPNEEALPGIGSDHRPVSKKERRKRVDPCTFEKQYTSEETEFMNAMQRFKSQTGKAFPTHEDVLKIAWELGYRKIGKPTPLPGCSNVGVAASGS